MEIRLKIMPLRGPTCKIARFQAGLKFPSWTECGNLKKNYPCLTRTGAQARFTLPLGTEKQAGAEVVPSSSSVKVEVEELRCTYMQLLDLKLKN